MLDAAKDPSLSGDLAFRGIVRFVTGITQNQD